MDWLIRRIKFICSLIFHELRGRERMMSHFIRYQWDTYWGDCLNVLLGHDENKTKNMSVGGVGWAARRHIEDSDTRNEVPKLDG